MDARRVLSLFEYSQASPRQCAIDWKTGKENAQEGLRTKVCT